MVQPKYSPEEALQRIKLMMEYDSSKTYTENKVIVENKQPINEIAWVPILIGAGVLSALGIVSGTAAEWTSEDSKTKLRELAQGCDQNTAEANKLKRETLNTVDQTKVANLFRKSFDWTFGGFGIGQGTGLTDLRTALLELENNGNFGDFCKVRERMGKSKFEEELIGELNTSEIGEVTSMIEILLAKSVKGNLKIRDAETASEQWWLDSFPCLEVTDSFAEDFQIEEDRYGNTYVTVNFKVKGQLKQFHILQNGRIYTADTHKWTGKKLVCSGSDNEKVTVSESIKKKKISEQADLGDIDLSPVDGDLDPATPDPVTPGPVTPGPVRTGYRSCSGSYSFGCKADAIATVQKCLGGLVVDGKFGPRTQDALKAKGYESFTDAEVDKICGKDTEISGESPSDTDQNNLEF